MFDLVMRKNNKIREELDKIMHSTSVFVKSCEKLVEAENAADFFRKVTIRELWQK